MIRRRRDKTHVMIRWDKNEFSTRGGQVCSLIARALSLANHLSDISHDARYRNWMISINTKHSSDELDAAVAALFQPRYCCNTAVGHGLCADGGFEFGDTKDAHFAGFNDRAVLL